MIKLTKEQIENWREVLITMYGSYALLMTDEEIEKYRERIQKDIDKIPDYSEE